MTEKAFFPSIAFGWAFYGVLVGLLAVSSVIDFRTFRIPKPLSIACAVLGLLFNIGRGVWLGIDDKSAWKFGAGPWVGACDGVLFSLAGFATGFAVFFGLWFLKAAGGGDLKLFAAVGCWVGPWFMIVLMVVSTVFLVIISMIWMIGSVLGIGFMKTNKNFSHANLQNKQRMGRMPKHRGMTYSLPLALATALTLLLLLHKDLGLRPEPGQPISRTP